SVNYGEHGMMHVSVVSATGDIHQIELHHFAAGGGSGSHVRTVSGVAVVNQVEAISVQVEHRNRMIVTSGVVRYSYCVHFVHEGVSTGSHAHRDLPGHVLVFHGHRWV